MKKLFVGVILATTALSLGTVFATETTPARPEPTEEMTARLEEKAAEVGLTVEEFLAQNTGAKGPQGERPEGAKPEGAKPEGEKEDK